jgi:hypothetical protein
MSLDLKYLSAERIWMVRVDGVEWLCGGDDDGPDAERRALIERAFAERDAVEAQARRHLDAWIDRARAAPGQDWLLEAVEAGRDLASPANHLQVCFTLGGDTYGWWQATLAAGPQVYYPVGLSRRER